jgi:hypothetical protein
LNRVLDEPLSSDEIAKDAYVFSFPMLVGDRIHWRENAVRGGI